MENVCDQSCAGEGVGTQQHGQRVVAVAFRMSLKHNLKTEKEGRKSSNRLLCGFGTLNSGISVSVWLDFTGSHSR